MNILLPSKKFRTHNAEVINSELLIYDNLRFEDLMYELTYASKKCICSYCGKRLKNNTRTMDHGFPRATGGISITNNLFPCCADCNSKKGDLTHDEFLHYLKLNPVEQKQYRYQLLAYRERIFSTKGFKLPKKWITYMSTLLIVYKVPATTYKGKKFYRISEFYQKYTKLPRPIIVDRNLQLLDGYNTLLFAQERKLKEVPVIILDNVILF